MKEIVASDLESRLSGVSTVDLASAAQLGATAYLAKHPGTVCVTSDGVIYQDFQPPAYVDGGLKYSERPDEFTKLISGTPEFDKVARAESVRSLVQDWATTSGDNYPPSLAIQESAVKEFGLKATAGMKISVGNIGGGTNLNDEADNAKMTAEVSRLVGNYGHVYQAFLRAQYTATQEFLKGHEIASVDVYRGMAGEPKQTATGTEMRPLSSNSVSLTEAERFPGKIYTATIPAERVLSIPTTGNGCLGEREVVSLGGSDILFTAPPFLQVGRTKTPR
jgi:hypothetical protein